MQLIEPFATETSTADQILPKGMVTSPTQFRDWYGVGTEFHVVGPQSPGRTPVTRALFYQHTNSFTAWRSQVHML